MGDKNSAKKGSDVFLSNLGFIKTPILPESEGIVATRESITETFKKKKNPQIKKKHIVNIENKTQEQKKKRKKNKRRKSHLDPIVAKPMAKKNGYNGYNVANKITKETREKERARWKYKE